MTRQTTYTTIIRPQTHRTITDGAKELWKFRELLLVLAARTVAVRYKQTSLGLAWVVLQPVLTTLIFTLVFGYLAKVPSPEVPYPVFVFSGLLLWQYFSRCVSEGSSSLQTHSGMLSKVYFPRMLVVISPSFSAAVDFLVALAVLLVVMLFYGIWPSASVVALPFIFLLTGLLGVAISLVIAPLSIRRRDIAIAVPFILQIGMYLSPIIYPVSFVPERLQWLFYLNPVATLLDGMRWALLGNTFPPIKAWVILGSILVILWLVGRWLFRRTETTMVDTL